jgi:glycosyltransferase involved in cell wall biosynthesis
VTTFAVSMCKDEADVIEGCLRHMADEVDGLLVADNGSTDGTRDILATLADELPLTVVDDPDPAYYQSDKMSRLAEKAAGLGAEWIVPFDADELWFVQHGRLRDALPLAGTIGATVARVTLVNHFSTAIDPDDVCPFRRMVWRQADPAPFPKVAFRWEPGALIHQGNHGVTLPSGGLDVHVAGLEIRHFPYRSAEQMVRKARNGAAAYRATDLPPSEGAHWRAYGNIIDRLGDEAMGDVFREHMWYLSPTDSGLVYDPAPFMRWQ